MLNRWHTKPENKLAKCACKKWQLEKCYLIDINFYPFFASPLQPLCCQRAAITGIFWSETLGLLTNEQPAFRSKSSLRCGLSSPIRAILPASVIFNCLSITKIKKSEALTLRLSSSKTALLHIFFYKFLSVNFPINIYWQHVHAR